SSVHGPMTYNVIPVHVPSSSHSSIKLHASSSSSAYPSGADGTRFHGTYGTPGAGVSFTGVGAQLVPNTGIVTAVCGLLGLLAYACYVGLSGFFGCVLFCRCLVFVPYYILVFLFIFFFFRLAVVTPLGRVKIIYYVDLI